MNIDWNRVNEKYPAAYKRAVDFIKDFKNPENVCFCDFKKFFKQNGIIISIIFEDYFYYKIDLQKEGVKYTYSFGKYEDDEKAEEESVYYVFKILEIELGE